MDNLTGATWRKSTRSGTNGGECVEVATVPGLVGVRDSRDTAGPVLAFGPAAWSAFLDGLRDDRPGR